MGSNGGKVMLQVENQLQGAGGASSRIKLDAISAAALLPVCPCVLLWPQCHCQSRCKEKEEKETKLK